ncbi:MAG TPA: oligosaccharide flippase family protein [Anaerolineales bacterium]|nr:oligosaccharide flippase family protein [Anaerolineales bacterium]
MSDSETRVAQNSLWMILSRFGAQGLAVVFTVLVARRLGSEGFGEYALIIAIIFVGNALTTFGTDMLLIREIAARDDFSRVPYALTVQLVLSGLFVAAVWVLGASILNQPSVSITALRISSFSLIPLAFFTVFTSILRGVQRMDAYASIHLLFSLLQIGAVLLLYDRDLILLVSLLLIAQTLSALFAGALCFLVIPRSWVVFHPSSLFLSSQFVSFLKEAAPIAVLALLGIAYQRLNIYLLATMSGAVETGLYSAAFRAVEASKTAHLAVFAALYPAISKGMSLLHSPASMLSAAVATASTSDLPSAQRERLVTAYAKFLLAGATIISLSLFILAGPLVVFLYGSEFMVSSSILQILAWILIPFTINTYLTLSLLALNRERLIGRALAISLLALLALNFWWIPARGAEGSAWAALVAECVQSIVLLASVRPVAALQGETRELSELS